MTCCSWVKRSSPAVGLGEDAERLVVVVDDHDDAVGPLVDQGQRLADRLVGPRVIGVS